KGIFIDGNTDFDIRNSTGKKVTTIIDGDAKNKYISMASIIAKQERDEFMEKLTDDYSKFSFYKHKGYGTKDHINNIVLYGVCDLHRITYLKKLMIRETINTNMYGDLEKINNIPIIYKQDKTLRRRKPSILIHICCVPDLTFPLKLLKKHFKVYLIWFNPNIQKDDEHNLRLSQLDKLLGNDGGKYSLVETSEIGKEFNEILYENRSIIDDFELLGKNEFIKTISKIPEYGKRCDICYYFRILEVGKVAESLRIDYFTTTLSISPKKNITKINKYGKLVGEKLSYSKFLFFDFRKDGGYIQSVKLTKKYGIYRQNYCGCNYSKKL
ncbi:MAG: epoxyqueuosine reductase QueH, partial [Candidatus Absconditabacteria bacterium]